MLKRTHLRELTLNRACMNIVRAKVRSSERVFKFFVIFLLLNLGYIRFVDNGDRTYDDKCHKEPSRTHHHYQEPCPTRVSRPKPRRNTHPIHSLPGELLAHIFVLGSNLDVTFPIIVSHVCSAWRDVALHTPSLWRRITLNSNAHYRLDMWRERIHRAKVCSLDIEVGEFPSHCGRKPPKSYFDIHTVQWHMHLVLSFISRWRSLKLSFPHYAPFLWNAALSTCCGAGRGVYAPLIEELSLVYPANDDTKVFTLFGGVAPRLTRLTIDGIRLAWLPSLFGNLTFLDYTHRGPIRGNQAVALVLDMVEVSSRLQELRISFPSYVNDLRPLPGHARAHKQVALPFLSILHLRIEGPDIPYELYSLLPHLTFPSLISLHLLDLHRSLHTFPRLGPFLQVFRPPPSLKYLWMECGWVDNQILPSMLRSLKGLRRAMVNGAKVPDSYFVGVAGRRGRGGYNSERAR
jgi:hypothetical protein